MKLWNQEQCYSVCGQCNGQAWLNASLYPNDSNEEREYIPEVFEASKLNIINNENCGNKFKSQVEQSWQKDDDEQGMLFIENL